jgi:flagellar protein FlaG
MDVNALKAQGASVPGAASPVAPAPAPQPPRPKPEPAPKPSVQDIVELSREQQVQTAKAASALQNTDKVRSSANIYHDDITNQFVVEIFNANNEEIKQIPSEDALKIAARFREATGLLFDQQA